MKIRCTSFIFGFFLCSCKKEYKCVCINPGGNNTVFTSKSNRNDAAKLCDKYYQDNFGTIPLNETYCEIK